VEHTASTPEGQQRQDPARAPSRPHVTITGVAFNDGTALTIGSNDIIAIVGPNNAGKSALLKEISVWLTSGNRAVTKIATALSFTLGGDERHLLSWVARVGRKTTDGGWQLPAGGFGKGSVESIWRNTADNGLQGLVSLFTLHLNTEARLVAASPVELPNLSTQFPQHPLHEFYLDDRLERDLERLFRRAFRQGIVVNRGAGKQTMLQVGERPRIPEGGDRQSFEFLQAVNSMLPLHEQGDGMRSFAGVLVSVLGTDRDIFLVDEPEAFLHPPQALLLGKCLAEKTPGDRQLFTSTHSSDVLRGLLAQPGERLRVLRITRDGDKNRINELGSADIRKLWADPVLRFSRILEGLFHDAVIVCEGDADCRFYEAVTDATFGEDSRPDILFAHGAGKSRTPVIATALKAIGVPVRVVLDFDALADEPLLSNLCSILGGDWNKVEADLRTVVASINSKRAELQLKEVRESIVKLLSEVRTPTLPDNAANAIRAILKKGSAWAEAKRIGKAFIPAGQALTAYTRLHRYLADIGLHIVEVGEVESFCRTIGSHGPAWVSDVVQRDLSSD
jgi:hypothetical protein